MLARKYLAAIEPPGLANGHRSAKAPLRNKVSTTPQAPS
jgi:hypothetical protein